VSKFVHSTYSVTRVMREVQKNGKRCSVILHRTHEVMEIKNSKAAMYSLVGNTVVYLIYFKHVSGHQ